MSMTPRTGAQHGGMDVTSGWRMGAAELPQIKRQKVGARDLEVVSALKKKNGLGTAGAHVEWGGTQRLLISEKIYSCILCLMKAEGLTIKDGRLINNRPVGESGIAEASRLRRSVKHMKEVSTIAEGIRLSELM